MQVPIPRHPDYYKNLNRGGRHHGWKHPAGRDTKLEKSRQGGTQDRAQVPPSGTPDEHLPVGT